MWSVTEGQECWGIGHWTADIECPRDDSFVYLTGMQALLGHPACEGDDEAWTLISSEKYYR